MKLAWWRHDEEDTDGLLLYEATPEDWQRVAECSRACAEAVAAMVPPLRAVADVLIEFRREWQRQHRVPGPLGLWPPLEKTG